MSDQGAFADDLEDALSRMHTRRDELRQAMLFPQSDGDGHDGVRNTAQHLRLEQSVLLVIDLLRPVALAEDTTADKWEDSKIDHVTALAGRQEKVTTFSSKHGVAQQETETRVNHIDPDTLVTVSRVLDELAYTLGFGPETNVESGSWDVQVET